MRPWMTHAIALSVALLIAVLGFALDFYWMGLFAGALLAHALDELGRWMLDQMKPATRHHRRIANAVESAVRQRSQTLDRDTGEHAA